MVCNDKGCRRHYVWRGGQQWATIGQRGPGDRSAWTRRLVSCKATLLLCNLCENVRCLQKSRNDVCYKSHSNSVSVLLRDWGIQLGNTAFVFVTCVNKPLLVINHSGSFNSFSQLVHRYNHNSSIAYLPRHAARRRSVHFPRCIQVHLHRTIRGDRNRLGGLRRRNTSRLREPPALHAGGMRVRLNQRCSWAPCLRSLNLVDLPAAQKQKTTSL